MKLLSFQVKCLCHVVRYNFRVILELMTRIFNISIKGKYPDNHLYFSKNVFVMCTHWKHLNEMLPISSIQIFL